MVIMMTDGREGTEHINFNQKNYLNTDTQIANLFQLSFQKWK